ncbi:MAG: 1-acyl-sn-glycerol-3-phosphate acyltransferase [Bacteroidota bacterium]
MKKTENTYPHLYPNIEDWPIYKLHNDRRNFVEEVEATVFKRIQEENESIEDILSKTVYLEKIRMKEEPWKVDPPNEPQFWKKISNSLIRKVLDKSEEEAASTNNELLRRIIHRYTEEIVGTFVKRIFLFARRFLTAFLGRLLNAANGQIWNTKYRLYDSLQAHGHVEQVRELTKHGTIVAVPTHFSNLDSILIGYVFDGIVGLPSFSYAAGLNLFNTGYVAYFMNRIGAYRLDRRKKNPIYLATLKGMSSMAIQRGTHSLVFPGGTRSRSGRIENRLKRGMLGTAVDAQRALWEKGKDEKVFIVPVILGYHFVLEAEELIEQHLKQAGKEQYLLRKDGTNIIRKFIRFAWSLFSTSNEIIVSLGKPMDVLGNPVDEKGESIGTNGQRINLKEYFQNNGTLTYDSQREQVYTTRLAERIVERYHIDNVVLTSQVVAFAAFHLLRHEHPKLDLYGLLRLPHDEYIFDRSKLLAVIEQLQNILKQMEKEGKIRLSDRIRSDVHGLFKDGIRRLGSYHSNNPLKVNKQEQIVSMSFKLLFYYHNHLDNYHLDKQIDWSKV